MKLSERKNWKSWTVFAAILFALLSLWAGPAMSIEPESETPGVFMPTLTPDDALRVNISFISEFKGDSAICIVSIRDLIDGSVLATERTVLTPGKGVAFDYSHEALTESVLDNTGNDLPIRVQIQTDQTDKIFIGFEIHDTENNSTRTYVYGKAEPLEESNGIVIPAIR